MVMKKIEMVSILVIFTSLLFSCGKALKNGQLKHTSHTSQNTLDWAGVYTGTTPCDDCAGQKMQLTLGKDLKYVLKQKFIGKSDSIFINTGNFTWNEEGNQITFTGLNAPNQFKVLENKLQRLDVEGKVIEGGFAGAYFLNKVNANTGLFNQKWMLFSLNGNLLTATKNQTTPYFTIAKKDSSVTGHLSCNGFGTKAKIVADTLTFSPLASTLMACEPMDLELQLSTALQKVKFYQFIGGVLFLNDEKRQNLATFQLDYFGN